MANSTARQDSPTILPPKVSTQASFAPTCSAAPWTRVSANPSSNEAISRSKTRSRSQEASCEVTGTFSFTAIRYGRTKSPARPNRVMAVNPITVATNRLRMDGRAFCGFRKTSQRSARP